jgi:hypothetical protein
LSDELFNAAAGHAADVNRRGKIAACIARGRAELSDFTHAKADEFATVSVLRASNSRGL